MKYTPIGKDLFIRNREKLKARFEPRSVAIFNSNDIMPTNGDGTMPFRQNSNLLYLSGIDQEESILLVAPDFPDPRYREVLFLKETSELIAIWEGHKYTKEEAQESSGIKTVVWKEDFERILSTVLAESDHIYLDTNEHIRSGSDVQTRNDRFILWCKEHHPLYKYERLAPIMYDLRAVKETRETELLQQACHITAKGFRRVLGFIKPGVWEFEVEAEYIHEFKRNRSRGFSFDPIIAGGANSCVLHYIENNQQLRDGDIVLMDIGAEYANYFGDMTRVVPVNGRFSNRQKAVYNAVLRVKQAAGEMLTSGNTLPEYHKAVGNVMEGELLDLGLIDKTDIKNQSADWPAYKKYFMHGTSHHLGLDVHDVGSIYKEFEPGMVFTVEPGIYIPDEKIGIRLEDDVVITETGYLNMMEGVPLDPEEIEDLMNA
ncbi:MAG: M24 family metallopeptidase [Roseivirga sp.]|nr:M24 family metallopeptidase [Roseivirga sp.]